MCSIGETMNTHSVHRIAMHVSNINSQGDDDDDDDEEWKDNE